LHSVGPGAPRIQLSPSRHARLQPIQRVEQSLRLGVCGILNVQMIVAGERVTAITGDQRAETVELIGLYWHFVDVVWIVIFTVVYLIPTGK